jgi:excisionase family DNA binding protein
MEALLMKVPEVAAQLGMSRAKVYELMASGTLRSVRVGGCRRVRTDDLIAFVANLDERWPEHVCTRGRSAVPSRR